MNWNQLAQTALTQYNISNARLFFLSHSENVTFRIEISSSCGVEPAKFLLRIHHPIAQQSDSIWQQHNLVWSTSVKRLNTIWMEDIGEKILCTLVMDMFTANVEIVLRPFEKKGFVLLPKRWVVVETTFGWLNWCRRLSKDYERLPETSETFIYIAMIRIMVRRLA